MPVTTSDQTLKTFLSNSTSFKSEWRRNHSVSFDCSPVFSSRGRSTVDGLWRFPVHPEEPGQRSGQTGSRSTLQGQFLFLLVLELRRSKFMSSCSDGRVSFQDQVLCQLWRLYLQKSRQAYTNNPGRSLKFKLVSSQTLSSFLLVSF